MKGSCTTGLLIVAAIVAIPTPASAQTWAGARQAPALTELFAIDATGETGWLYGQEDVAGDGVGSFKQQEQSIDIRTAYASTDAQRFWFRVYVSDTQTPGGNVSAYVFIDADKNASTGGSAAASAVDAKFTTDASPGGYEFIFGVRGNASVLGVWEWRTQQADWSSKQVNPTQATAEAGAFLDPVRLNGDQHGYLQGAVDLGVVGLTTTCTANLYVRTTNETASLGAGDLEVGQVGSCIPADGNNNGVPDPVEPTAGCTTDAQCANGGLCVNGKCIFAPACASDADCAATETCTAGRCVVKPTGTTCTDNAACSGLVCSGGQCVPCTPGGSECGAGSVCRPDGRCGSGAGTGTGGAGGAGVELGPEDEIQGGACACSLPGRATPLGWLSFALPLLLLSRRARRARSVSNRR